LKRGEEGREICNYSKNKGKGGGKAVCALKGQ
jgi:hypothetical protein